MLLRKGLEKLEAQRDGFRPKVPDDRPVIAHSPIRTVAPGDNVIVRATVGARNPLREVVLRVGVRDTDRAKVDRFGKELAPLVTSGPPGVTGFAGGRPKATEVLGYWPTLIPKERVRVRVDVEEVE